MRAAKARGVKGIVWVNLRVVPGHSDYRRINAIIADVGRAPADPVPRQLERLHARKARVVVRAATAFICTSAGAVGLVRLVRRYVARAADGPTRRREPAAGDRRLRHRGGRARDDPLGQRDRDRDEEAALTGNSPPVGPNLGGPDGGSGSLGGVLVFAGGAALMLFLVLVTVKRRGAT